MTVSIMPSRSGMFPGHSFGTGSSPLDVTYPAADEKTASMDPPYGVEASSVFVGVSWFARAFDRVLDAYRIPGSLDSDYPGSAGRTNSKWAGSSVILSFDHRGGAPTESVLLRSPQLSKRTAAVLGKHGQSRLAEFREYPPGWDDGIGKPFDEVSLSVLEYFLTAYDRFDVPPSIFFSREGNVILGWEDASGGVIELEFTRSGIEFYVECAGAEGEVALDAESLARLVALLP